MIRKETLRVTTTGSAGSASGSATTPSAITGEILGVLLNYTSQPATTDVTLATAGEGGGPALTLLTVANANTDGYFAPRAKPVDNANVAITNAHVPFVVSDKITIDVAQGDAVANALTVTIFYDDR